MSQELPLCGTHCQIWLSALGELLPFGNIHVEVEFGSYLQQFNFFLQFQKFFSFFLNLET